MFGRALLFSLCLCTLRIETARCQEQASIRLETDIRAVECADIESFKNNVRSRLGFDPFQEEAEISATMTLRLQANQLIGRIELHIEEDEQSLGHREFVVTPEECEALMRTLASTLALLIDSVEMPESISTHENTTGSRASQSAVGSQPVVNTQATDDETPWRNELGDHVKSQDPNESIRFFLGIGARFSWLKMPSTLLGPLASFGIRVRNLELALRGSVDVLLGRTRLSSGDEIDGTITTAGLIGCGVFRFLRICPTLDIGALQAKATGIGTRRFKSRFVGYAGLELGVLFPLLDFLSLRLNAALNIALIRTHLRIEDEVVWIAPPASFSLGIDTVFHF